MRVQDWKHRQAQKAGTVQRTAKRRLADDSRFESTWKVEHVGAGAEERTETWGSMVKRRYQPPVRDRAFTSLNDRKNLIFEGACVAGPLHGKHLLAGRRSAARSASGHMRRAAR